MIRLGSPEDVQQYELLISPLGTARSGAIRYAAAMYFYKRGMIDGKILEAYRACCKQDSEDPAVMLASMGFAVTLEKPRNGKTASRSTR